MYTYALLVSPSGLLKLPLGIAGQVEIIGSHSLAALVEPELSSEDFADKTDEQLMEDILTHDRVICHVFSQTDLLPLRFGTCFVSQERLLDYLESHGPEYRQKLAHLQGKAEYTLKCNPVELSMASTPQSMTANAPSQLAAMTDIKPDTGNESLKGRQYFLAKKRLYEQQMEQQAKQDLEWQNLGEILTQLYPEIVLSETQGSLQKVYFLVRRQEESVLFERFQDWQAACPSWELSLGNALPPYHFV